MDVQGFCQNVLQEVRSQWAVAGRIKRGVVGGSVGGSVALGAYFLYNHPMVAFTLLAVAVAGVAFKGLAHGCEKLLAAKK